MKGGRLRWEKGREKGQMGRGGRLNEKVSTEGNEEGKGQKW